MQLTVCLLSVIVCLVDTSPVSLGSLEFDNLDTDLDDLTYQVEEEDVDDFSKLFEDGNETAQSAGSDNSNVHTSGFKKKSTTNNGQKKKHDVQDLKKFFKAARARDEGSYDGEGVYGAAEGAAARAVGVRGAEGRSYRRGAKTRGFHRVHHKDEYKKDKVFYEDDETKGTINKVGAKAHGYRGGAGAGMSRGRFHHDRANGALGKRGYSHQGHSNKDSSEYSDSLGFDGSFVNESK